MANRGSSGALALVDSGTTTTRVRVARAGRVACTLREQVGARDTARDGHNHRLRKAMASLLARAVDESGGIDAAVFSGMVTSNVGLLEIPHLPAPVAPDDLARAVVRHDLPEVTGLPCYFIPGVRTGGPANGLAALDLMRGEEVEVSGLRELLSIRTAAVFVHYGSHHKAIDVGADGTILASRTSLTGELLDLLREQSILKSSTVPLDESLIQDETWRLGMSDATNHGAGRALYLVRVGEQVGGYAKPQMTSYLLGVLAGLDLPLVASLDGGGTAVLYGRSPLKHIMATCLRERRVGAVLVVDDETADAAAALGATAVLQRSGMLEEHS